MDELSNIEARRDFNVANLRRAFGAPDLTTDAADKACRFADILRRLAAREALPSFAAHDRSRLRAET